jgi:hypothetical protein
VRRYFIFATKKCRIYAAFGVSQTPNTNEKMGGETSYNRDYSLYNIRRDTHKLDGWNYFRSNHDDAMRKQLFRFYSLGYSI